jgi:hypothetical protein
VPPNAAVDDAVTMALQYAGIEFAKVWDAEVLSGKLRTYDWLHLHHEDTGQSGSTSHAGAPGSEGGAHRHGEPRIPSGLPSAWRRRSGAYVERDFLRHVTATETLTWRCERGVNIAAAWRPESMDPNASS